MVISDVFITFLYQPFFNVLVGFYQLLNFVTGGNADMGIAVIFLTILIRILLLPMSLAGQRSEPERRQIMHKIAEIEQQYSSEPIKRELAKKKIMKQSTGVLIAELINLVIQVAVALMLWKIFQTGLLGEDLHLMYSFMPQITEPFNLVFLGKYDLTHTNFVLNLMQSILIFVLETISLYTSPYPVSRKEVIRMQLVLPVVSFLIFMALPAGKKLFVITSLIISIILVSIRAIQRSYQDYVAKKELEQQLKEQGGESEKLVVEVK